MHPYIGAISKWIYVRTSTETMVGIDNAFEFFIDVQTFIPLNQIR